MGYQLRLLDHCTIIAVEDGVATYDPSLLVQLFDDIDLKSMSRYIIDLTDLIAVDASALGFFLLFNGVAQLRGKSVALVTGGNPVCKYLERLSIDTMMLMVDRLDQAGVRLYGLAV